MSDSQGSNRKVVITGIGVLSPIGIGVDAVWQSLAAGKSGIAHIDRLSFTALPDNVGGEIKDFTDQTAKKQYLKKLRKNLKVMCREIQLGVASAALALESAGLAAGDFDGARMGVAFGANQMLSPPDVLQSSCATCIEGSDHHFEFTKWGTTGLQAMEPLWLLKYLPNMPACHIGIFADARGPNNSLTLSEASGNLAMGEGFHHIRRNTADMMIAGTTGTRLHPVKALHAALWDELATTPAEPERRSRPFERDRSGQVVGEASCSFLFEEEEHARSRGATILGTVLGTGASCVIDKSGKPQLRLALVNAMNAALRQAGISTNDVGHVNAHGVAEVLVDIEEAKAIRDVFGDATDQLPVTALKSFFGNSGAGTGTLELAASLVGLNHSVVPPTLNYDVPDPECPLNIVHGEPLPISNKIVMNINVTKAGQASAMVVCGA